MDKEIAKEQNPLGKRPIPQMLLSLAVPAVIANLVNAVYNTSIKYLSVIGSVILEMPQHTLLSH